MCKAVAASFNKALKRGLSRFRKEFKKIASRLLYVGIDADSQKRVFS